jgi:hypothetical protein
MPNQNNKPCFVLSDDLKDPKQLISEWKRHEGQCLAQIPGTSGRAWQLASVFISPEKGSISEEICIA